MTKNQLIKKLQKIEGNPIVICSSDAEGNNFSELDVIHDDGETFWDKESRDIIDDLATSKEYKCKSAIILFPV